MNAETRSRIVSLNLALVAHGNRLIARETWLLANAAHQYADDLERSAIKDQIRALEKEKHELAQAKVRVKRVSAKRYELFAPGVAVPFHVAKTQSAARSAAYTYARYRLGNQSAFEASCIEAEGWTLGARSKPYANGAK